MKATLQSAKRQLFTSPRVALLALILGVSLLIGVGTVLSLSSSSREVRGAGEQLFAGNLQGTPQPVTPTAYLPLIAKNFCPAALERMPFGVEMLAEVDDPAAITLAREGGAHWTRTGLSWATIEPTNTDPANFNWTTYDQRFANLAAAGLIPIVIIGSNPTWAAEYPCGPITDTNLLDFADFLTALVSRYKDPPYNVKYWELYNEPDCGDPIHHWGGCWGNDGDKYAAMLQVAYPAIKGADPEAKVVFGGLAYDFFESDPQNGPFVESFLDDVLIAGGGNYFDIMNFHYYEFWKWRWQDLYNCSGVRGMGVTCKAVYLGNKLATYGLSKPIFCTELSRWSTEEKWSSEENQARYVPQAFARGMSANLESVIWFTLVDYETKYGYGLLNPDYSEKKSYQAYQILSSELAGAQYLRRLPDEETGGSQIEAYEFTLPCPDRFLWVVWTNDDNKRQMDFPVSRLRVVDKYGSETIVIDGQAGDLDDIVNGKVRIWVLPGDPLYASGQKEEHSSPGDAITAWYNEKDVYTEGERYEGGTPAEGDLALRLYYRPRVWDLAVTPLQRVADRKPSLLGTRWFYRLLGVLYLSSVVGLLAGIITSRWRENGGFDHR